MGIAKCYSDVLILRGVVYDSVMCLAAGSHGRLVVCLLAQRTPSVFGLLVASGSNGVLASVQYGTRQCQPTSNG